MKNRFSGITLVKGQRFLIADASRPGIQLVEINLIEKWVDTHRIWLYYWAEHSGLWVLGHPLLENRFRKMIVSTDTTMFEAIYGVK